MTTITAALAGMDDAIGRALLAAGLVPVVFLLIVGLVLWVDSKGWI